jgi:anthranilate phosphoribosyltransferase
VAEAIRALGAKRALIVRGNDGLDELSLCSSSRVFELQAGEIKNYEITPEEVGLARASLSEIEGFDGAVSAKLFRSVLSGEPSAYADLVAFNAGAALYLSGKTDSIKAGVALASAILLSKKGLEVLDNVVELTNSFK